MGPFFIALLVACVLPLWLRNARMAMTAVLLFLNWVVCTGVSMASYDVAHPWAPYPWGWYFAADYVAAFVVLVSFGRPNIGQAVIGIIYSVMLVRHASYAMGPMSERATYLYSEFLGLAAWGQVLFLTIGWGGYEMVRHLRLPSRRISPSQAVSSLDRGSEG